jgi:mannose-6-phosphate isomerase-like protein (cupin superfamily)
MNPLHTRSPLPARLLATIAAGWARAVRHEDPPPIAVGERTYSRVLHCDDYDVWVIHWSAGSGLEPHDHAESSGAFQVVRGELLEQHHDDHLAPMVRRRLGAGRARTFPVGHVHEVRNPGQSIATSVHVYSPPLTDMTFYPPRAVKERHLHAVRT